MAIAAIGLVDGGDIGQEGAADAEEGLWVEHLLQLIKREIDKIAFAGIEMSQYALVAGLKTGDFADRNGAQAVAGRDQQTGLVSIAQTRLADSLFLFLCRTSAQPVQLVEGVGQVGFIDRLEQIGDAVGPEGLERVFIVRRTEDRRAGDFADLEQVETGAVREANIKEDKIWRRIVPEPGVCLGHALDDTQNHMVWSDDLQTFDQAFGGGVQVSGGTLAMSGGEKR